MPDFPGLVWRPNGPGTGLFSQGLMTRVSWALERFTAVFGMGTGGPTPLSPPGPLGRHTRCLFVEQGIGQNTDPAGLMKRKIGTRALGH